MLVIFAELLKYRSTVLSERHYVVSARMCSCGLYDNETMY